jgi:hypothetical protein
VLPYVFLHIPGASVCEGSRDRFAAVGDAACLCGLLATCLCCALMLWCGAVPVLLTHTLLSHMHVSPCMAHRRTSCLSYVSLELSAEHVCPLWSYLAPRVVQCGLASVRVLPLLDRLALVGGQQSSRLLYTV